MSRVAKTQLIIEGQNKAQPAFTQADKQLTTFTSQAKAAAGVLAGVFSIGALAGWVKESALATAQMGRLAQLAGSSAEEFQGWAFAAKSVGIEQDKLGDIFKDVQDKVGDYLQTGGGTLADFFENIAPKVGVTAEQFRNLSGPEALGLYVSSLEKANLSQSEMVFYMESIANDATLLLPLLEGNAAGYLALRKEAEELGLVLSGQQVSDAEAFRDSLQALGAISEGAGKQLSAELLPTLNQMAGLLSDASTEAGYAAEVANVLSFGLKALAAAAIIGGNAFGSLGRFIGGAAAAAASAAKGEFKQAADIMRMVGEDNARETGAAMDRVKKLYSGAYENAGENAGRLSRQIRVANENMAVSTKVSTEKIKAYYADLAKSAKAEINKLTAAQRDANTQLERLQQQRLEIDERYSKLRAALGGGAAGPSYGQAEDLKVAARNALRSGDLEGARANAQAAARVLEELARAGENTYGLQGFANELQAIEQEANGIEQSKADAKLKEINLELTKIQALADVKIEVGMTQEQVANAKAKMQELAVLLGKSLVITPTIAMPEGEAVQQTGRGPKPDVSWPAYASGGHVRGPGTGTSDSIIARLSNGEYVMRAAAVRKWGVAALDRLNGLQLPKFATGGLVGDMVANAPMAGPASIGTVNLTLPGGESYTLQAQPDQFDRILRRTALKFGRR